VCKDFDVALARPFKYELGAKYERSFAIYKTELPAISASKRKVLVSAILAAW
jgi:hypothetical protein